jgi:hypothetical protein
MPALYLVCPEHQRARARRLLAEVDGPEFPLWVDETESGFVVSGSLAALRHALCPLSELWLSHCPGDDLSILYVEKV